MKKDCIEKQCKHELLTFIFTVFQKLENVLHLNNFLTLVVYCSVCFYGQNILTIEKWLYINNIKQ